MHQMSLHSAENNIFKKVVNPHEDIKTDDYWLMNGDCVEKVKTNTR